MQIESPSFWLHIILLPVLHFSTEILESDLSNALDCQRALFTLSEQKHKRVRRNGFFRVGIVLPFVTRNKVNSHSKNLQGLSFFHPKNLNKDQHGNTATHFMQDSYLHFLKVKCFVLNQFLSDTNFERLNRLYVTSCWPCLAWYAKG